MTTTTAAPPLTAGDHIRELTTAYSTTVTVDRIHQHLGPALPWGGWRRSRVLHTVVHRPLLDQLEEAVQHARDQGDASSTVPRSKPTARLDAIATLARIDRESATLAAELGLGVTGLRRRLHGLAEKLGAAPNRRVRSWWVQARCVTGWEDPPYVPHVPCPNVDCERWDTLRIRVTDRIATCVECHATWTALDVDEHGAGADQWIRLGQYVRWAAEHLSGARHWVLTPEGNPIECVECLPVRARLGR